MEHFLDSAMTILCEIQERLEQTMRIANTNGRFSGRRHRTTPSKPSHSDSITMRRSSTPVVAVQLLNPRLRPYEHAIQVCQFRSAFTRFEIP